MDLQINAGPHCSAHPRIPEPPEGAATDATHAADTWCWMSFGVPSGELTYQYKMAIYSGFSHKNGDFPLLC